MAKYIIDIPYDTTCINALKYEDSKCVAARSYIIPDLTPYTEPDEDEIRQKAHEEAWEFAKTVSIMKPEDKRECWGTDKYNTINLGYSYQEAKAKYEAWKAEKAEIRVGDEVEYDGCGEMVRFVVTGIKDSTAYGFRKMYEYDDVSDVGEYCDIDMLKKTGRHFDEVAKLLKKMRGE